MGQYWYGVMEREVKEARPMAFQNPETGCLKLMEHSWWKNPYVNWFCKQLSECPYRVGWIGDYAMKVGCPENLYDVAHGEDREAMEIVSEPEFTLEHKYLVNHTMGVYTDSDIYRKRTRRRGLSRRVSESGRFLVRTYTDSPGQNSGKLSAVSRDFLLTL